MERKLAAIFSADVQGYSRLMGQDEEATVHTLKAYRAVMTHLIEQHRGRVVDSPGDNLLAEFVSVVDAVKCAQAIQQELARRNAAVPEARQMRLRTYLTTPFLLAEPGFTVAEIAPVQEGEETWRCLRATFPDSIATHSREQDFYFGPDGLLWRHDYHVDVAGGFAAA
jgi:hypothetical protein